LKGQLSLSHKEVLVKILVAYDGSMCADSAIEDMRRAGLPPQAEALVLCVSGGELHTAAGIDPAERRARTWTELCAEAESLAETGANRVQSYFPQWKISTETLWGSPARVIVDVSKSWKADLIVAGSHGHSAAGRFFLGSVSMQLVHHADCSVRVTRTERASATGSIRILLGNDGSASAESMIQAVAKRSWPEKTEARIVSVASTLVNPVGVIEGNLQEPALTAMEKVNEQERTWLRKSSEEAAKVLRAAGLSATDVVLEGDPRQQLIDEAERWNAEAIFLGARGLGRLQRLLLGSVSSYVVRHAHCTVEVVR
jgi:nucleotide-binding universal stress UspA family protein